MGTIEDKLKYLNTTKIKLKDSINLTGANITNDTTFRNYSIKLKESLVNILKGNIWDLFDNFDTVEDSGEEVFLNNSYDETIMKINLKGNTKQDIIEADEGITLSDTLVYANNVDTDKENTIEMSGNTYQESTTGKNLLNTLTEYSAGYSTTINGITFTINEDGTITANGTVEGTDNARFTFINNTSTILGTNKKFTSQLINGEINGQCSIFAYDNTYGNTRYSQVATDGSVNNITLSTNVEYTRFRLIVYAGTTVNNAKIGLMVIDTSETDYTYEPFTNGASPNPDYPQNIEVVTGNNTIKIEGKNLFDDSVVTNLWSNYNTQEIINLNGANLHKYECKQGDTYTLSATFDSAGGNGAILIQFFDKEGNSLGRYAVSSNTTLTQTRTAPANTSYAYIGRYFATPTTIQLEKNTQATTYEPYQSQSYPINLGNIELCKIGDYQDRIYKSNDKWYLEKQIGNHTINSDDVVSPGRASADGYARCGWGLNSEIATSDFTKILVVCNKFLGVPQNDNTASARGQHWYCSVSNDNNFKIMFRAGDSTITRADFPNFIKTNNVTVYYPLATPTTTEITDTNLVNQLNALYNATIYPITNINTETSNLLPYIDLHYNFVTPSPSPSRPSVVNVVTGNNNIKVVGKNLLDTNRMVQFTPSLANWYSVDGIDRFYNETQIIKSNVYYDLKANTTYTFSVYSILNKNTSVGSPIQLVDKSGQVITSISQNKTYMTFTATEDIRVYPRMSVQSANVLTQCIVQLEQGSTVSTFEPYVSQTYPINLGNIELCKIGDYQDRIYYSSGKWYKYSMIGKAVLSQLTWVQETSANSKRYSTTGIQNSVVRPANNSTIINMLCNIYIKNQASWTWNIISGKGIAVQKNGQLIIFDEDYTNSDDLTNFTTMLGNKNAVLYYPLATPTTTEITDTTLITQLDNIKNNARSYDNQTNITQEDANAPFIITAEAIDKTKI